MRLIEAVTVDPELYAAGTGAEQGLEYHGHCGFPAMHARIQVADGRGDLPAKDCADQNPAEIALLDEMIRKRSSHDWGLEVRWEYTLS